MKPMCECCGKALNPKTMVSLELDQRVNAYHDFGNIPDEWSQGWFDFGSACAKKERARADALLDAHLAKQTAPA